jgi:hypothetical protein
MSDTTSSSDGVVAVVIDGYEDVIEQGPLGVALILGLVALVIWGPNTVAVLQLILGALGIQESPAATPEEPAPSKKPKKHCCANKHAKSCGAKKRAK